MDFQHGVLCLTFDDSHFDHWVEAAPLFAKYNAFGTFFCSGEVTPRIIDCMKQLIALGHSVGLHTLHHADAPKYFEANGAEAYIQNEVMPQLDVCRANGIDLRNFAYPNNLRNEATDEALKPYFDHFRAGVGVKRPDEVAPADFEPAFHPVSELPAMTVMGGIGVGEYYHTKLDELEAVIRRAAAKNEVLTIFSHDIAPGAPSIHMPTETLEFILKLASSQGMAMLNFDRLPRA